MTLRFDLPPSIPQYQENRPVTSADLRSIIEWISRNNRRTEDYTAVTGGALQEHIDDPDPHPQYVPEGFGGIVKTTDTNYGTVGSGAWTTIDNWDEGMVFSPIDVVQDVANSGLRIAKQGTYRVAGTIAISFTDTNQGRVFAVRLWNDTKSIAGRAVDYFVGRNQEGVNISQGALLFEVGIAEVNDLFQIQIAGSGDSFSNVAVVDALFSVVMAGTFGT